MKVYFLKLYYSIILLAANRQHGPTLYDKFSYWLRAVLNFAPVAFILDWLGVWFANEKLFFSGMLVAISINLFFGYRWHKKLGDFKWRLFWSKNIEMWIIIICVYPLLYILSAIAGDNFIGEGFKIVVQITTILYPGSKALKNAHLLSEKRYPPAWLMNRFFTFEKTGNVKQLFETDINNEINNAG